MILVLPAGAGAVAPGTGAATGVFVGKAVVSHRLCYPDPLQVGLCNAAKKTPATFSFTAGPGVGFSPNGSPTACVGVSQGTVHLKKMAPPTYSHGPLCAISTGAVAPAHNGNGTDGDNVDTVDGVLGFGPWCGLSSGLADGTVTFLPDGLLHPYHLHYLFEVAWVGVGGTLVMTGDAALDAFPQGTAPEAGNGVPEANTAGVAAAVVNAAPDLRFKGQSCSQLGGGLGANEFLVVGVASAAVVGP